jgi:acyl carrier protein
MKRSLLEIINEVLSDSDSQVESITSETDLRNDLGMDSMNLALLTVLIEDEYRVDVFEDGMVSTVADIEKKING